MSAHTETSESVRDRSPVELLLTLLSALGTASFLALYITFASVLWSESIPKMRFIHGLYVGLVAVTMIYGLVGRRRIFGLCCNTVLVSSPAIYVIGILL